LYLWIHYSNLVTISPLPSKLPQQTIEHEWSPRTLCPSIFPLRVKYILMDPAQNLFGIMYIVDNMAYRIYLATLDDGHLHPHTAGPALDLELSMHAFDVKLECYGRPIALWRNSCSEFLKTWHLQIWDWWHSTTSSSALNSSMCTSAKFLFSRKRQIARFRPRFGVVFDRGYVQDAAIAGTFPVAFPAGGLGERS
ncbi:uncharacterized protein HD556DRAFT_1492350, partial [Suillus plorans]